MGIASINVGRPRTVTWGGWPVTTAIFKEPVTGRAPVRWLNLEGDGQADLSVHGGRDKAVYVYPAEHYADWRRELPDLGLPPGMFGENLTMEGLREDDAHVGGRLKFGSAEGVVTQPRLPCYKLAIGFIPSKALVKSAKVADLAARAAEFGVCVGRWPTDMPGVLAHPTMAEGLNYLFANL